MSSGRVCQGARSLSDVGPVALNLACGLDIREGWLNVDGHSAPGVDVVADLFQFPWPLASSAFEVVEASHFMEHVPRGETFARVMEEVHRVLVPGGKFVVKVPHFANARAVWSHPDHKGPIFPETWEIFAEGSSQWYFSRARFALESWGTSRRCARWPRALRVRGVGLSVHVEQRLPVLRWAVTRPLEATYVLRRVGA